jgi:hypothetical protein
VRNSFPVKDELNYWRRKIHRIPGSPYFYVEIQRDRIRRKISLETSNKAAAAARAREIWQTLRVLGWPGFLAKYKPETAPAVNPSVGDFIEAVRKTVFRPKHSKIMSVFLEESLPTLPVFLIVLSSIVKAKSVSSGLQRFTLSNSQHSARQSFSNGSAAFWHVPGRIR